MRPCFLKAIAFCGAIRPCGARAVIVGTAHSKKNAEHIGVIKNANAMPETNRPSVGKILYAETTVARKRGCFFDGS
jgi:hypothetical protein